MADFMKNKKLMRQFQKNMLVTVAVIAILAMASIWFIGMWQNAILPNDTELFIDVISTYADGKSYCETYSLDLANADGTRQFKKKNEIEDKSSHDNTKLSSDQLVELGIDGDIMDFYVENIAEGNEISDANLTYSIYDGHNYKMRSWVIDKETVEKLAKEEMTDEDWLDLPTLVTGEGNTGLYSAILGTEPKVDTLVGEDQMLMDAAQVQTGTQFAVSKIENGFSKLSSSDQKFYTGLGYAKFILPILYSLIGVILSSFLFYKRQIKIPIATLAEAAEKISNQNLDFEIASDSQNELGRLCDSFEDMREALSDNNSKMLQMIEERRRLQSSVSHDLRNPIAIMKGYIELMESDIKSGESDPAEMEKQLSTIKLTTDRMEAYVKSVNEINHLEDMTLTPEQVNIYDCIETWEKDARLMVEDTDITINFNNYLRTKQDWRIDANAISRILENVVSNAMRYAKGQINITIEAPEADLLTFEITDDGPGYPEKLLKNPDLYFYTTDQKKGHMGMGMTVCRILCKKHGGSVQISNIPEGGACTVIKIVSLVNS